MGAAGTRLFDTANGLLSTNVGQIVSPAARLTCLAFEAGDHASLPARGPAANRVFIGGVFTGVGVDEVGVGIKYLAHDQSVFFPVGGQAPDTTGLENPGYLVCKGRGD